MVKGEKQLNFSVCTTRGPKEVNQTKKKQREVGRDDGEHCFGLVLLQPRQTTPFFPCSPNLACTVRQIRISTSVPCSGQRNKCLWEYLLQEGENESSTVGTGAVVPASFSLSLGSSSSIEP